MASGAYGTAYAEAQKQKDSGGAYATRVIAALEAAPEEAAKRVKRLRADGYPADAARLVATYADSLAGIPGGDALTTLRAAWKKDRTLSAELKAEKAFLSTAKKAAKAKDAAKARALWEKLLKKHGDTPVAARIREKLEAK